MTCYTSTKRGIDAFITQLTSNSISDNYKPNATNTNNSKYLIVFTDGKDTDTGDWVYDSSTKLITSYTNGSALDKAKTLKNNDYTIFTVLMRSGSMTDDDVNRATAFLKEMSGTKNSTAAQKVNYFFDISFDDPKALADAFERIAKEIAQPLDGYVVRDYIDPRFDLLDEDGNVLTRLNSSGVWLPRATYTADGKRAMLKYDEDKKMFYVEVENQTLPTVSQYATEDVIVNSIQLNVRAKDDFIGGNDILSNGNEDGQNMVFKPIEDYNIQENRPIDSVPDTSTTKYSKDFPKTTTNPATLDVALSDYEDTIFLGETISPASLYEEVQEKRNEEDDDREIYMNYLIRIGLKYKNDANYYLYLLKYGETPTKDPENTFEHYEEAGIGPDGESISEFKFEKDVIGVTELTLPYYYLHDPTNARSYAGGDLHQADQVGKVTYTWKALTTGGHTLTDNNALKDYTSTTLDTVKYQLSVSYTPDAFVGNKYIATNGTIVTETPVITDNGSVRTQTLTGQRGSDNLIRNPVGAAATAKSTDTESQGLAVVHVVAGKIKVKKRIEISQDDWNKLVTKAGTSGLTFTFTLMKDGANYGTVSINTNSSTATVSGNYIELTSDWITDLPKGTYTLTETGMPTGFTFTSVSADTVVNADGDNNNGTQFAAPTTGSVTWYIGKVEGGSPSATTYGNTDFSYTKVNDTSKEVDPNKDKAYLNAQIGKAIVLNEPPRITEITIIKVDSVTGEPLTGAKFSLKEGAAYSDLEGLTITNKTTGATITTETITVSGVSVKVFEIPSGGIKIDGLVNGTYTLTEEIIPDGYGAIEGNRTFKAENGVVRKADDSGEYTNEDANFTFKIQNEPGAELPSTGGPGTRLFTILGSILILGSGVLLWRRRRLRIPTPWHYA